MTIYCGLLFSQEGEDRINDFNTMALIILIIINAMFLIEWFYLFLLSFNVKNDKFIFILHIYGSIIWKKRLVDDVPDNSSFQNNTEEQNISTDKNKDLSKHIWFKIQK